VTQIFVRLLVAFGVSVISDLSMVYILTKLILWLTMILTTFSMTCTFNINKKKARLFVTSRISGFACHTTLTWGIKYQATVIGTFYHRFLSWIVVSFYFRPVNSNRTSFWFYRHTLRTMNCWWSPVVNSCNDNVQKSSNLQATPTQFCTLLKPLASLQKK